MQEKLAQVDEVRKDVILQEVNVVLLQRKRKEEIRLSKTKQSLFGLYL